LSPCSASLTTYDRSGGARSGVGATSPDASSGSATGRGSSSSSVIVLEGTPSSSSISKRLRIAGGSARTDSDPPLATRKYLECFWIDRDYCVQTVGDQDDAVVGYSITTRNRRFKPRRDRGRRAVVAERTGSSGH
jgi:hypothetical protein